MTGDKAYFGCDEFVTEWKKPYGGQLSRQQLWDNRLVQHYRGANAEAMVSQLKSPRKSLSGKWRGSLSFLAAVLHIAINMVGLEERMRGPRFDHYGPWPVAPRSVVESFRRRWWD